MLHEKLCNFHNSHKAFKIFDTGLFFFNFEQKLITYLCPHKVSVMCQFHITQMDVYFEQNMKSVKHAQCRVQNMPFHMITYFAYLRSYWDQSLTDELQSPNIDNS